MYVVLKNFTLFPRYLTFLRKKVNFCAFLIALKFTTKEKKIKNCVYASLSSCIAFFNNGDFFMVYYKCLYV